MATKMTGKQLTAICRLLFGERWQRPAAREIGCGEATLYRYKTDAWPIPDRIVERLQIAVEKRWGEIRLAEEKIDAAFRR